MSWLTEGILVPCSGRARCTVLSHLHLAVGSPCINAGDPACLAIDGETDMDGQPRVLYGTIDIGADEYRLAGDCNCDGYVNVGDLQQVIANWDHDPEEGPASSRG